MTTRDRASAPVRWTARVTGASLTVKLTVLAAAVTSVVLVGTFFALSIRTRLTARRLFAEQLATYQQTLVRLQQQNLDQLVSSTALITQSPTLRSALASYRLEANLGGPPSRSLVQTVEVELSKLVVQVDRDLLVVTDASGDVFAAASRRGRGPPRGTHLATMPAVRRAIAQSEAEALGELAVYRDSTTSYQVAVYPLVLDGFTIGSLLLGERLDSGLVAATRSAFEGDVVVATPTKVLAASFPAPDSMARVLARSLRGGEAVPTVTIGGRELAIAPLALGESQSGERVELWLLQPLDATVTQLNSALAREFALYGLVALVLAVIGAAVASRSVLRPFRDFVGYLRSAAAADGQARFETTANTPEIQTLNESFEQLMDSIAAKQRELTTRTTELAAANAVLRDEVRERQRVEHQLGEREEQLRQSQKLEAIGTLAGGIAHDFNNMLTAVSGFTQLALMNMPKDSPAVSDMRQVVEAADRAGQLTQQLLAFSRKQVLRPTVLDLGDVVHGVEKLLSRLIGEHITLRVQVADALPKVLADRGQLEQVIVNLAVNARDAMPRGGTLTLSIGTADDRGAVVLRVSDTGSGIPEAIRPRIFEPFFTTKESGKGTGLGLSTVYGIVTQSGGTITLDSTVGAGTTFTVSLPVATEDAVMAEYAPASDELPRGSESILLVEDDAAIRTLARRTLESCGYTVLPAGDPEEALALARTARVDMILSDMLMPKLSGPQMVHRFMNHHPAVAVVFMSGYADDGMLAEGRALRSAFLRKPFTPNTLARTVREALDTWKQPVPSL